MLSNYHANDVLQLKGVGNSITPSLGVNLTIKNVIYWIIMVLCLFVNTSFRYLTSFGRWNLTITDMHITSLSYRLTFISCKVIFVSVRGKWSFVKNIYIEISNSLIIREVRTCTRDTSNRLWYTVKNVQERWCGEHTIVNTFEEMYKEGIYSPGTFSYIFKMSMQLHLGNLSLTMK